VPMVEREDGTIAHDVCVWRISFKCPRKRSPIIGRFPSLIIQLKEQDRDWAKARGSASRPTRAENPEPPDIRDIHDIHDIATLRHCDGALSFSLRAPGYCVTLAPGQFPVPEQRSAPAAKAPPAKGPPAKAPQRASKGAQGPAPPADAPP
jgi:hypothetical protein